MALGENYFHCIVKLSPGLSGRTELACLQQQFSSARCTDPILQWGQGRGEHLSENSLNLLTILYFPFYCNLVP